MTIARRAALVQLAALSGGCANPLAPVAAPAAFVIDRVPVDVPKARRTRGVMVVRAPTCRPVYDTLRMAYRVRGHETGFYARHEWAERPPRMLHPLLVRTLEGTHCCRAVLAFPPGTSEDFVLGTSVDELLQDFTADPPLLRFALRIELFGRDGPLLAREVAQDMPIASRNAEAGVAAANAAVAQALHTVAQLVVDALA
jgi:ABC-type uncharacterized transport system auxiliary subunit